MVYNIMTCTGFEDMGFFGGCSIAWLGLAVLFFIIAFSRKGIEDFTEYSFAFPWAVVAGILAYVVIMTLFGDIKWSLLVGIVGGLAGGFLLGPVFGGESE